MATKIEIYNAAKQLKEEGQLAEAIAKFQESAAMDEKFTSPLHAMVQCLTELGRHDEAIATAQKCVQIEPDDYFSYIALSIAYQRAGMIPEAEYAMAQGRNVQFKAQMAKQQAAQTT